MIDLPAAIVGMTMVAALLVHRRAPLLFIAVTSIGAVLLLDDVVSTVLGLYVLLVPAYVAASSLSLSGAGVGFGMVLGAAWTIEARGDARASAWVFSAAAAGAAWTWGRAVRHRRMVAARLARSGRQLAGEEESRTALALAEERSRIARELQVVIAQSLTAMVHEARAAQRLVIAGDGQADDVLASLETTGRQTLAEMRRLLGVLRRSSDSEGLGAAPHGPQPFATELRGPQPRVGQIAGLIERARWEERMIDFQVVGEPRPLPASSEIAVYRVIEEALAGGADATVSLRFDRDALTLRIEASSGRDRWPSERMGERIAVCRGAIRCEALGGDARVLTATIPLIVEEWTV